LGGYDKQQRFSDLQRNINDLIKHEIDDIDDDVSPYCQQLLNTVKCNNVCFNMMLMVVNHRCPSLSLSVCVSLFSLPFLCVCVSLFSLFGSINVGVFCVKRHVEDSF
jgi:hypothetical protein